MTIGGEQQIGSAGAIKQLPTIAALPGGGWAAVWQQAHPLSGQNILAQTFDAAGTAGPIQTVSAKPGNQTDPSVAVLTDGGFVVAWTDGAGDVWQHLFNSAWQPLGPDLLVGTTEPGNLSAPTVSALADGGWLVSWTGPDGDGTGVFQRSYAGSPSGNLSPGEDIVLGTSATETLKVEAGEITAGDQLYGGGGGDNLQIVGEKLTIQATAAISGFDELLGAASDDDVIVENGNLPFAQIDLGIGTDTLVFDGTANLIGRVVKGVEKIVLLNDSDISLDDKALALLVFGARGELQRADARRRRHVHAAADQRPLRRRHRRIHDANGAFFAPALAETAFNTAEEIPGANIGTLKGKVGAPTLTLFGNYNGLFELVPISGDPADGYALKLKAGLKLDYETDLTTIVLKVEVSDINGTVVEDVVVTLQAVNEYTPQILSPAAYNVAENTTEVTDVIAIDGDKDTTLTYSITGTDATLFTIDAKTGELDFKDGTGPREPAGRRQEQRLRRGRRGLGRQAYGLAGARGDGDECRGWQGAGDHVGGCVRRRREHDGGDEGDGDGRRQPVADLLDLGWSGRGAVPDRRDGGPEVQVGAGLRVRWQCCQRQRLRRRGRRSPTATTPLRRRSP